MTRFYLYKLWVAALKNGLLILWCTGFACGWPGVHFFVRSWQQKTMQPPNRNHENVTARPIQTYKISTNNSAYIKKTQHKPHADIETNKHTTGRTKRKHSIALHKTKVAHCAGPRVGNHTKNNNMEKIGYYSNTLEAAESCHAQQRRHICWKSDSPRGVILW